MSLPEPSLWRHRARVAEAMILLLAARGLVLAVPFRRWRAWLGPVERPDGAGAADGGRRADPVDERGALRARRLGRAVEQAARFLPGTSKCLPQAMAAAWMLRRRSIPAILVFGVLDSGQRGTPDDLHAWVVCGDQTITGQGEPVHLPILVVQVDG